MRNKINTSLNVEFFFANYERTLSADFQFAQMDLARATLVLIRVLRTFINSIAKNLHKLQICLRFYSFYKKLDIQAKYKINCAKIAMLLGLRIEIFYKFNLMYLIQ